MSPDPLVSLAFLSRIIDDFLGVSESLSSLHFVETTTGTSFPAGEHPGLDDEWGTGSLVVISPTRTFAVSSADRTGDEILVEIADVLVDCVMDDLGHPWPPSVHPESTSPLQPFVDHGQAWWIAGGRRVCLIGELKDEFAASGWDHR